MKILYKNLFPWSSLLVLQCSNQKISREEGDSDEITLALDNG
jgi:hypothetical protein